MAPKGWETLPYSMSYGVLGPLLLPLYNGGESLVWNSTVHQTHSQWVLDCAWAVTFHWIWSSFLYTQFIGAWDAVWGAFRILSLSFIGNIVLLASSGGDLLLSLWKVIPEVEETGMKVGTSKSEAAALSGKKGGMLTIGSEWAVALNFEEFEDFWILFKWERREQEIDRCIVALSAL